MSNGKNKIRPVPANPSQAMPVTKPVTSAGDNEEQLALKEEILRWILSVFGALVVYFLAANIIKNAYHPDINVLLQDAQKILIEPGGVRPEPMEAMLFRSGVVVVLLSLLGFYILFTKVKLIKDLAQKPFFFFVSCICIILLVVMTWFDFAALNPFYAPDGNGAQNARDLTSKTNFDFYFEGFFLSKYLLIYAFVLIPLIAVLFFFGIKKRDLEDNQLFNKVTNVAGYAILGMVILACFAMSVFYFPYSFETKYNFNAVYYSMTQVNAGSPLLVNGFSNTYGLYPQFLNLLFHFIGLSVVKFTSVMALLISFTFIANFYVLRQYVKNNIILFLGILTVIFFPFLDFKYGQNFDCNFAYYPIRYLIPSTLILLSALYLRKRSPLIYWITFTLSGFFILWNPEIGLVCYLSWLLFNTYNDFYSADGKINGKKILFHWLAGILVFAASFYIYKLVIYAIYGASPDLGALFSTIQVFGKIGFNLLPMSLVHPWNIMALILILSFLYAISKWYKKEITPKVSLIFLISFIGLGFFAYFQGRSHNWQLAQSSSMSLILLTLMGSDLWDNVKKANIPILNALFVFFLFLISFSLFEIVFNVDRINELVSQDDDKTKQEQEQQHIESNLDFILKNSKEKEKIYVFSAVQHQDLYFDGNKRVSAFNPGIGDLFLKTDLTRLEHEVVDSSFTAFIEPGSSGYGYLAHTYATFGACYDVKAVNQSMYMLSKRKTKIPAKTFFSTGDDVPIHKKYNDDTAGINARINDAFGIKPVTLNPVFSTEVLFYSETQMYPFATLVGNMNDSTGFIIANVVNTQNYFIGVNGKGIGVQAPKDQWVYFVLNVYPDHMEVYVNGGLAGTFPLATPIRQSPEKVSIGNRGSGRYYIGAISEVAVHNKALDKNQVELTWEEIKKM